MVFLGLKKRKKNKYFRTPFISSTSQSRTPNRTSVQGADCRRRLALVEVGGLAFRKFGQGGLAFRDFGGPYLGEAYFP